MRTPELLIKAIRKLKPELTEQVLTHHLPRMTSRQVQTIIDNPDIQKAMKACLDEQLHDYVEWVEMCNADRHSKRLQDEAIRELFS